MARSILIHEAKIVGEMLADSGLARFPAPHNVSVPQTVYRVLMDEHNAVNAGSMILFRHDASTRDCKVVSCSLFFPCILAGEIYLAQDVATAQLAFLDLIPTPGMPRAPIQFLSGRVSSLCSHAFNHTLHEKLRKALTDIRWFSTSQSSRLDRSHSVVACIRMAYLGGSICFMFSEAPSLFTEEVECLCISESSDGAVQALVSENGELALDGWCHLTYEEWKTFLDCDS